MSALLAVAPALPLHTAGKYVAGAYIVFVVLVLVYVAIMAIRLAHTQRELRELQREVAEASEDALRSGEGRAERDLERV
jgi:hypothetical protein